MRQEIYIPKLLREECVLQRGEKTRFWCWYQPDMELTVHFQGKKQTAKTDAEGFFSVFLACMETGGPFRLEVEAADGQKKSIEKVFVGDVFVCSGQSNMELQITRVREMFPDEKGCALVHQYKVEECAEFKHPLQEHVQAAWNICVGEPLEQTTALGYFFGKMIAEKEQVPVGIINISKGGTPITAWMSIEGLAGETELLKEKKRFEDDTYRNRLFEDQDIREQAWHENLKVLENKTENKQWKTLQVPGIFAEQGLENFCGLLYLKRTFSMSEEMAQKDAVLKLGTLVDSDKVFINGIMVGETGYCFPPRIYKIPTGVLKYGQNEIVIRLECRDGKGRITGDKPCGIYEGSDEIVNLRGTWQYQIRVESEQAPILEFITRKPTGMFQGMVAPCLNMTVKGVLWYQGESDEWQPHEYEKRLKNMVCDWRSKWGQQNLPFIIIQLPACDIDIRGDGSWAWIREAQQRAEQLPDVAVTVNLDLGEYNDLHPLNKKGVAYRAYLAAQHLMYKKELFWKGPCVKEYEKMEEGIRILFDTGDGKELLTDGKKLAFETAGKNGVYYPAEVRLGGKEVFVYGQPQVIRYAWADAPLEGLLKNHEGLFASPFRIELNAEEEKRNGTV